MLVGGVSPGSAFDPSAKGTNAVLSAANTTLESTSSSSGALGTLSHNSGKWYFEITISGSNTGVTGNGNGAGIGKSTANLNGLIGTTGSASWGIDNAAGVYKKNFNNGLTALTSAPTPAVGDIIGVAYDAGAGRIDLSINGTFYNSSGAQIGSSPSDSASSTYSTTAGIDLFPMGVSTKVGSNFGSIILNTKPNSVPSGYTAWG